MGNTASGNKGCFIKPKKAWRLLKTADEGNVTAYIFGVSGSGKTTLVSRYLGTRKYMVVDAGGIRPDDLVVESSNARKIITLFVVYIFGWFDFWFAILEKNLLFVCKFKLKNFNTQKLFCILILINF